LRTLITRDGAKKLFCGCPLRVAFYVVLDQSVDVKNVDEQRAFDHDDTTCKTVLLSIIGDSLIDVYVQMPTW
jgi:ABC-type uncharacterized transport system permease subunit